MMIELKEITKIYPSPKGEPLVALSNINLAIESGEVFGAIGPSGAGKSTLIRCANLLERPTHGTVWIDRQDVTALSEKKLRLARRQMGMIFQHFNLLSSRTVYENICLALELAGNKQRHRVESLLELTGLADKKNHYPHQLSGGQKQRVAIARALANHPKVLLSDEATSALDPENTHAILQLLKNINQTLGVTILLITHEMAVVKEICHRLAILEEGEIVECAKVIEFFSNPKTDIAKRFIRKALQHHLPETLQQRLVTEPNDNTYPLLQISFVGQSAQEPVISQLIQKFAMDINILQANIEMIRNETVGIMIVEALSGQHKLAEGIEYLRTKGVPVEIIGYVKRNH